LLHHTGIGSDRSRGGGGFCQQTDMAFISNSRAEDRDLVEIRPERFRMCAEWEMDIRYHFDNHPAEDGFLPAGNRYWFEVVRDEAKSVAERNRRSERERQDADRKSAKAAEKAAKQEQERAERQAEAERKEAEKRATELADTKPLVAAIEANPTASVRELERLTGIGRNRITRLAELRGYTMEDGTWTWKQTESNPDAAFVT
jgi:predicted flap endonuclease-1-like 5' DNA nuclease